MNSPDAEPGYLALFPPGYEWPNRFIPADDADPARLPAGRARPARVAAPLLVQVMSRDVVTPPAPARKAAARAPRGELVEYPGGHFDIYVGEPFERAVTDQIEFLDRRALGARDADRPRPRHPAELREDGAGDRRRAASGSAPTSSVVVHTGQHYDRAMSEIFFEELGVPEPDHMLGVGSGSHGEQTARVLERLEPVLRDERPDLVLVPGDVNSTLAAALCAARLGIPVGHVESGLRSFDRTMPEEINRVVADHLSELLFLHSPEAEDNLRAEGVAERSRIQFVGNTMIDTLVALEDRFRGRGAAARRPGSSPARTCSSPCTARRSSTARCSPRRSRRSSRSPRELPVVFPVHPRTRKMLGAARRPARSR